MNPPTPYGSTQSEDAKWKARGGVVKMVGFFVEGVGVIVSALSLGYFLSLLTGNGSNTSSLENSFVHTLEAGIIIGGIGVIVIGIGVYLSSRQR
jgi:hypothetical protein